MSTLKRFVRDESAGAAIEYGLIAAGMSMAMINVVQSVGANLKETFTLLQGMFK